MKAHSERKTGNVLEEYYYNGHEKTLKVYHNKVLVEELKGDEAKERWHSIIDE